MLRKSTLVLAVLVAIGALPAADFAQDTSTVEVPNSKYAFEGEINASSVNIRSGPADSYYPVVKLNKGDKVVVVGYKYEWLKVEPPQGAFSLIHKDFVDRQPGVDQGTVSRDNVYVRAGSTIITPPVATPQLKLDKGTTVTILGEQGDMLKVAPPKGAYVYVLKKFVDPVRQTTTRESATAGGPTTRETAFGETPRTNDAGAQGTSTDLVPVPPLGSKTGAAGETPAQDEAAQPKQDAIAKFRALEQQYKATKDQPLDQRPVQEMLKGYQDLLDAGTLPAGSAVRARQQVQYLTAIAQQQKDLIDAQAMSKQLAAKQSDLDAQQKQIEEKIKSSGIAVFAAVGKLDISTLKKDDVPLLRLIDPNTNRTLVYIQTTDKVRNMLGQYVGIRGEVVKDERLGVNIIDPTEATTIDADRIGKTVVAPIQPAARAQ